MKKEMSKMDIQAKMDVLKELYDMCSAKLGEKVKGGMDELKSVTVSAPDTESLHEGLEMASELTPEMSDETEEKAPEMEMTSEESDEEEDGGSFLNSLRKKKSRDY